MSPRINGISGVLSDLTRQTTRNLQEISGARSPALLKAAQVLRTGWRRVLSVPGGGRASAPGDAPKRQTGKLARSVKQALTETGRKVAVTWFTAPMLEAGVDTALPTRANRRGKTRVRQGRYKGGAKRLVIAPRPSAARALAASQTAMDDAMVGGIRAELGNG